MKIHETFLTIVLVLPFILFSQDIKYSKILFCKAFKQENIILSEEQIKINLPHILFDDKGIKSTISLYIERKSDLFAYNRKEGGILVCGFYSDESLKITRDKILLFSRNNYSSFKNDFDYKEYFEFVETGLIVVIDYVEKKVLLIRVNSCMFPDQKNYVLNKLKKYKKQNIYVFNCAGNQLISIIK